MLPESTTFTAANQQLTASTQITRSLNAKYTVTEEVPFISTQKIETNQEKNLIELKQHLEKMEKKLHDSRQHKENIEKQLHDMTRIKEETEEKLYDMMEQIEKTEKKVLDMKVEKEEVEQHLYHISQEKQQSELQIQILRLQKEEIEQQFSLQLQQRDMLVQQMRLQAERADDRALSAEQELRLLRQQNEVLQTNNRHPQMHIQSSPDGLKSSWKVDRNEIQVIQEKPLGVGGWGQVKVALFRGTKVAAKFIHEEIISPHNIDLFIREMNMAACVRHPNLLLFIGASLEDNKPVIITELMPTNLRTIISTLSRDHTISISIDVASGLNYLHLMRPDPIVHRDVSTANVLLEPIELGRWRAKVSDYGSANFVSQITTMGPGNASYAAPESFNPRLQSSKMDVYSYGIVLLEMATGQFPDIKLRAVQLEALVWKEMAEMVKCCIRENPEDRPDMEDILQLLHVITCRSIQIDI